jgi:lipopolysaccharide transport system ATP-binding protein
MSDSLITVEDVSKKFCRSLKRSLWYGVSDLGSELLGRSNKHRALRKDEFWAVKDVSFEVKQGETLGLIGRNGAGKTTLLRMLNGLIKPDAGRIEIKGRMQALIALGAGFNPILTGRENVYVNASVLGIPKVEIDRRFDEIVDFSGIEEFLDTPVQNYSSGMAVRLGFAVAAHMDPDILLVDEVLAVGDEGFQLKCLNKIGQLKQKGTAIILVSHNMHTLSTFASSVIVMNNGMHELYNSVPNGIRAYRQQFFDEKSEIEKINSGNDTIRFYDVEIGERIMSPGDSFYIKMKYDSSKDYKDVEVDLTILSFNEASTHFQATNKAYECNIHFKKGKGELKVVIQDIRVNNANGRIAIAIWTKNRIEWLFWWRIPVEFKGASHATGNNFLNAVFELNHEPAVLS